MLYFFLKQQGKIESEGRMFLSLLACNAALLILELCIDLLGIFYPSTALSPLLSLLTIIFYSLNPVPGVFYFLFIQHIIGRRVRKRFLLLLLLPFLLITLLSLASAWTGWLFVIDDLGCYSRGPYFFITIISNYTYLFFGPLYLLVHRSQLQRKLYSTLLVFPFPVAIAGVLQIMFYGIEVLWISLAISLLILFFNVEANQVNRDYLTGLFNRRYFQRMAALAFDKKWLLKTPWACLLDINNFKYINDTCGHAKGDDALILIGRLLEQVAPPHSLVSRYGGDEFALLTTEIQKEEMLDTLKRLQQRLQSCNAEGQFPSPITISVGCAPVRKTEYTDLDTFLHHLDISMYQAKTESRNNKIGERAVVFHLAENA